jgi:phospholipid/cholesterol/gamma-HCH transport system substrate-binding protein
MARATDTGYFVSATFNRIDGLPANGAVRVGGIQVGSIVDQRLDEHFRAVVTLHVDDGVELPTDTSAAILTESLFGSKYIELEPGGDATMLRNGDAIKFTQDSLVVSDLLDLIIAEGRANLAKKGEAPAP